MTRELSAPLTELVAWLARDDHDPVHAWEPDPALESLHCHPDLVERLSELARPIRGSRRVFVAGCPVIHEPGGRPLAAAAGTSWLVVRSAMPAGDLAPGHPLHADLAPDWVELDPWTVDVSLARGIDLLRAHVARAFSRAERGL